MANRYPLVDIELSRRLERTEGHANRRFVESRARHMPGIGAGWIETGGVYAMFDGVKSPISQTFGLGMFEPPTAPTLDAIERFFAERGSDTFHEVSPLADASTLSLLNSRGYQPCELTSVMFQPLPSDLETTDAGGIFARPAESSEQQLWSKTAFEGWREFVEVQEFMGDFGATAAGAEDSYPFLAFDGESAVAAGGLHISGGVALLAGASTVPHARGRGAQRALLTARLHFAAIRGCTLAMMGAAPGSPSQRNAERSGFRIAYTRIKWHKVLSHDSTGQA